jgi:hypothetical protein
MTKEEREVLRKVFDNPRGLLSQSELINAQPQGNTKLSHTLITSGYIEEVKRVEKARQIEITCYRITEKGRMVFAPPLSRFWHSVKGDLRTIIVSIITALLTTAITILITSHYGK